MEAAVAAPVAEARAAAALAAEARAAAAAAAEARTAAAAAAEARDAAASAAEARAAVSRASAASPSPPRSASSISVGVNNTPTVATDGGKSSGARWGCEGTSGVGAAVEGAVEATTPAPSPFGDGQGQVGAEALSYEAVTAGAAR
ncbi:unnamed protein product [Ectocarpus sp. 4 AP-2014]